MKKRTKKRLITLIVVVLILAFGYSGNDADSHHGSDTKAASSTKNEKQIEQVYDDQSTETAEESNIPDYDGGSMVITLNNNDPGFTSEELSKAKTSFESYPALDSLGRCQTCTASVSPDTMPTEKRGSIGMVKPSGWHTVRYDDLISDKYLYNRCHLIAYCLTGENANRNNLITGTREFNAGSNSMLTYENRVADYVDRTGNHVLYQVTPYFKGNDLVARGVIMKAQSIEDNGQGIKYNVFVYNVQPGIKIDYATGDSSRA